MESESALKVGCTTSCTEIEKKWKEDQDCRGEREVMGRKRGAEKILALVAFPQAGRQFGRQGGKIKEGRG